MTKEETARSDKNTSIHYYNDVKDDDEVDLLDLLPPEMVAMIESARSFDSSLLPSSQFYATYTDGESCSIKSSSEFNSWETSYNTLDECCAKAFGWDYDACMNVKRMSYQTK